MPKMSFFKPKRSCRKLSTSPFPIGITDSESTYLPQARCTGTFTGFSVEVDDLESMAALHYQGCFGKGNLSRSQPEVESQNKTSHHETLHLSLEEAFFLSYALGCLQVRNGSKLLNLDEMWNLFRHTSSSFISRYFVYHHFRSEGWTVKSGIKFGADFLLYKTGPAAFHASYCVQVISPLQMQGKHLDFIGLASMDRTSESAGKELLFCYVSSSPSSNLTSISKMCDLKIEKVVWKRWVAAQER